MIFKEPTLHVFICILQATIITVTVKRYDKTSEAINGVLPRILKKSVQELYTAFGREVNGKKKKKFMETAVYKEFEGEISKTRYIILHLIRHKIKKIFSSCHVITLQIFGSEGFGYVNVTIFLNLWRSRGRK